MCTSLSVRSGFFAFISVPPPALFIAGRSHRVTATNTLTRYGFLQSPCEGPLRCEPRCEPRCPGRAPTESRYKTPSRAPRINPECGWFERVPRSFLPPRPRCSALRRVFCGGWNSSPAKGKVNLCGGREREIVPPPPHPTCGCPVTPVMSRNATEPIIGHTVTLYLI